MDIATFSEAYKGESEQKSAEQLLKEKVRLDDGTYNFIFTSKHDEFSKNAKYRCNVCDVMVLFGLHTHVIGKKHSSLMAMPMHPSQNWSNKPVIRQHRVMMGDLKLAPGEPVPPGFEDEVCGVTEIQASLDAFHSGPLIGLEYLVELAGYQDEREPQYICLLCDKRGDPRTIMTHLVSFRHCMTYLQSHFPTVYRAISPYNTKQFRRNVQTTVQNICEAVEKKFGRMIPQSADRETFEKKKEEYMEKIMKDNHPSERSGETFEYLVDKEVIVSTPKVEVVKEVEKANEDIQMRGRQYRKSGSLTGKKDPSPPIVAAPRKIVVRKQSGQKSERERSLSSISSISSSSFSSYCSKRSRSHSRSKSSSYSKYSKRRYKTSYRSRSRSPYKRYYRRSRFYSASPPPKYKRELHGVPYKTLPWQKPEYRKDREFFNHQEKKIVKNERLEDFKKQCDEMEAEMAKILDQHEKKPEKHPLYPEEWKKFWNRRYKEVQAENKDPIKHDFKPEWIQYWYKRMREMHEIEVKEKKDAIRKRLNLPEEPSPISFKIVNKNKQKSLSKEKEIKPSTSDEIIIIDDSKEEEPPRDRKRSHSPWESEDRSRSVKVDYSRDYYKQSRSYRKPLREPEYKKLPNRIDPPHSEKEEINIVAILRLLTALEEKLGSLGPKVIEMLSQALALEKAEANSSETLLDLELNCVFFETVKEKLKGQLLAGMVEPHAEKTFKNCIQKIASLLHFASERKKEQEKKLKIKNLEPVKIPGIGTIDKQAIAKQIATALIVQGKTDVTQQELEQLINAVVGMAQASQNSGKLVSTAAFIQQLSNPMLASTELISTLDISPTNSDLTSSTLQMVQNNDVTPSEKSQNTLEGLSDSDLKTLLQNFKDLSTDEQHGLITYLKKLEAKEPERVERLRKFVKIAPNQENDKENSRRMSPFSNREADANPSIEDSKKNKNIEIDSDDEEYTIEDVLRAASKNVTEKQQQEEQKKVIGTTDSEPTINLNDAKQLITNLMGQLSNINKPSLNQVNLLGLQRTSQPPEPKPTQPKPEPHFPNQNQQNYNYNYPNRPYQYDNNSYNNSYQNYNYGQQDYGFRDQGYGNGYPGQNLGPRGPPFNRNGPQYNQYDPRQNYY